MRGFFLRCAICAFGIAAVMGISHAQNTPSTVGAEEGWKHVLQGVIQVTDDSNHSWGGPTAQCSATFTVIDRGGDAGAGTSASGDFPDVVVPGTSSPFKTFYKDAACHKGNDVGVALNTLSCAFIGSGAGDAGKYRKEMDKIGGVPDPNHGLPPDQRRENTTTTFWLDWTTTPPAKKDKDKRVAFPKKEFTPEPGIDPGHTVSRFVGDKTVWANSDTGRGVFAITMLWSRVPCRLPPPPPPAQPPAPPKENPPPQGPGAGQGGETPPGKPPNEQKNEQQTPGGPTATGPGVHIDVPPCFKTDKEREDKRLAIMTRWNQLMSQRDATSDPAELAAIDRQIEDIKATYLKWHERKLCPEKDGALKSLLRSISVGIGIGGGDRHSDHGSKTPNGPPPNDKPPSGAGSNGPG